MDLFERITELSRQHSPFALATVVKTGGSVPGKVGFKILVEKDGRTSGTVGGGALEKTIIEECLSRIESRTSGLQDYILTEKKDIIQKGGNTRVIPMMCEGKVTIFYDIKPAAACVYLFGGGHVGHALSFFLARLDLHVILIDNREEFANPVQNPHAHNIICRDYLEYSGEFNPPADSYAIIMTHGHQYDYQILKTLLERKLALKYIGVIASRSKASQLKAKLRTDLGDKFDLSQVFTPIGLDIGGDSETEIALSIAAEIQAIRHNRAIPHLADKIN
jgi:xanthine dehydrogenase accessory factor